MTNDSQSPPWRGVSLGGWLLLEPGPSNPLFSCCPDPKSDTGEARCEWDLLQLLQRRKGKPTATDIVKAHREGHITKKDFQKIKSCGLNSVRLPFGYWIVLGPAAGEPYQGPALEFIDSALDWAEEFGLQVVLDLHGCPGGESGEAPSGRRQRPDGTWKWKNWRFNETLKALDVLVKRYHNRRCVTGITVCNEPSNEVPQGALCRYYLRAIERIRNGGMSHERVAIVLPLFQREVDDFMDYWQSITKDRQDAVRNICFDVHCYHCFENEFNGKTLAQHLRYSRENAEMLSKYPMVVGEWSLALGVAAWTTCGDMPQEVVQRMFCHTQLAAYNTASHGWFFWNWTDRDDAEWNYQSAHALGGCFSGPAPVLPAWSGDGEDPLEEQLNPSPAEPAICYGDTIYLRAFYGRYVDVEGTGVQARWADKSSWQEFIVQHSATTPASSSSSSSSCKLQAGSIVRLQSSNGRYLSIKGENVSACHRAAALRTEFVLHLEGSEHLQHRGTAYFQSRATNMVLDVDDEAEGLYARYEDFGEWQQFAVEKKPVKQSKKRSACSRSRGVKQVKQQKKKQK